MKKKEKQAIEEILENFDFEAIHTAMEALDWTWFDSKGKTPNIKALKKTGQFKKNDPEMYAIAKKQAKK